MNAFLTGSRVYGSPQADSDIDLVVRVDETTAGLLRLLSGNKDTVRFGKLNVILCTTDKEFAVWKLGTEQLRYARNAGNPPVDKYMAKEAFDHLRSLIGLLDEYRQAKEEDR